MIYPVANAQYPNTSVVSVRSAQCCPSSNEVRPAPTGQNPDKLLWHSLFRM